MKCICVRDDTDACLHSMSSLLNNSFCIALQNDDGIWATMAMGCHQAHIHAHNSESKLDELEGLADLEGYWTYRVLSYDLKDAIEKFPPHPLNTHSMPMVLTVRPSHVCKFRVDSDLDGFLILEGDFTAIAAECHQLMGQVRRAFTGTAYFPHHPDESALQPTMTRHAYKEALSEIQDHLQRGDIYEVNYCQEFIGHVDIENPFSQWLKLLQNTSAPFAAYMQHEEWVLICASPERFLQRKGQKLISQPIKGTARRSQDPQEDHQLRQSLSQSPKDRSENIMIVDLVRNDMSRLALKDTVKVKELCGVYSFKTVHHLISTIEALIPVDTSLVNILQATFPMGSMTGAPKISAIQIAQKLENFHRGWYSGSIGFVAPNGDINFNVIIRSAVYHRPSQLLRCGVGGAITMASMADAEYEETLLKANAIRSTM